MPALTAYNGYTDSSPQMSYSGMREQPPPYRAISKHSPNGYSTDQHSLTPVDDGLPPSYLLEHLATFTVSPEQGLVYPADGMRRLLQMEKTAGIWTQKMLMRLEPKWVIIQDNENGDVVERFPMSLICEPTAFTSSDPKEIYNNILVFIVAEESRQKHNNPPEMHIFQCVRIRAQDVVEDMKDYMSGQVKSGLPRPTIPPPPDKPPPDPPINGSSVKEHIMAFDAVAASRRPDMRRPDQFGADMRMTDDASTASSEKSDMDINILNHCFDDIERFIARLQHAVAAFRELEKRQKQRKSKKKDMHGEGMIAMRAKPPPEHEFVDVFQKFKLSFNLLAKLKAHIHDPNSPELVHFLFTPLALIVDASRDTYGVAPPIPSVVVAPLLTRDAVDLLNNCLTSKETELWHSLGESWVVPRDQWNQAEPHYRPVFKDGWSPEYPIFPDDREREKMLAAAAANKARRRSSSDFNPPSPSLDQYRGLDRPPPEHHGNRSDVSNDSAEHFHRHDADFRNFDLEQQKFLEELKERGAKIIQVTYPRTGNNDKELTVTRGEYLEVIDDSRKWWKARNYRGQVAHVPHTIVSMYHYADHEVFTNPVYGKGSDRYSGQESGGEQHTPPVPPPPVNVVEQKRGKRGEFRYF